MFELHCMYTCIYMHSPIVQTAKESVLIGHACLLAATTSREDVAKQGRGREDFGLKCFFCLVWVYRVVFVFRAWCLELKLQGNRMQRYPSCATIRPKTRG